MKARRSLLAVALLSSLLGAAALDAQAATSTAPERNFAVGSVTAIDWAIDAAVAARNLSAADAALMREQLQMQFQSLSAEGQQQILNAAADGGSKESALRVVNALGSQVATAARQAESAARQADMKFNARLDPQAIQPKLGADGDLVYLATVGPCRIYDSRNGPGQLPPATARQVYTISILNGYSFGIDQGGSGVTGSGNCVQTAFGGTRPTAVVATVTVVNTTASGALQAWNGGTTLNGGAVVNWNAGDRLSNTTIIPMDRSIAAYPGSGGKRDIGVYNNSGAAIDFVIDVVGYMIENQATALDCTTVSDTLFSLNSGASILRDAPACPSGYTPIMGQPVTNQYGVYTGTVLQSSCRISNTTGATVNNLSCNALCCRVPGR